MRRTALCIVVFVIALAGGMSGAAQAVPTPIVIPPPHATPHFVAAAPMPQPATHEAQQAVAPRDVPPTVIGNPTIPPHLDPPVPPQPATHAPANTVVSTPIPQPATHAPGATVAATPVPNPPTHTSATSTTVPTATATATATWYVPAVQTQVEYQLSDSVVIAGQCDATCADYNPARPGGSFIAGVTLYDYDVNATRKSSGNPDAADTSALLHASGRKAACYINAGAADIKVPSVLHPGAPLTQYNQQTDITEAGGMLIDNYGGYPDERWIDISTAAHRAAALRIASLNMDKCVSASFDAVDPDNINAWTQGLTGATITRQNQTDYNRSLAAAAHGKSLGIALKNDNEQASDMIVAGDPTHSFDFVVSESCVKNSFCGQWQPFITAGKLVFDLEYADEGTVYVSPTAGFCASVPTGIQAIYKPSSSNIDNEYLPRRACSPR